MKTALLARDMVAVDVLKMIKSPMLLQAKEQNLTEPTDEICQAAIYKQIQNYQEAIELLYKLNQSQAAQSKESELKIVTALLPPQLSEAELIAIIERVLQASQLEHSLPNFKDFLREIQKEIGLGASSSQVAKILKTKLS